VSDNERPESAAFRELEILVRHLGEELANFRRRALQAETHLKASEGSGASATNGARAAEMEAENATLRARLDAAAERARGLANRVRFLRQQTERGANHR
jgi:hypothetical protein